MNLRTLVAKLEALSNNLEFAQSVRERVRIADRIYEALNEIEQRVETFVVKEIGQSNGAINTLKSKVVASSGETMDKKGRFADLIARELEARSPTDRFACDMLVAGISQLVTARLAAGDLDGLRALHGPLTDLVRQALTNRAHSS